MKNSGLFLNMAKRCFLVVFSGLMLLWFVFCVSGKVARVLKMLVFPRLLGFCGVAYSCLFGFGRFRCFSGSCVFFFCSCFGGFCVFFLFVFSLGGLFLFFRRFLRVRWGGPKGHLTWPQSLLIFCFAFFGCLFWFLCFLFLFLFGGFKGQVRWLKGPPHLALNPPFLVLFCWFSCLCV